MLHSCLEWVQSPYLVFAVSYKHMYCLLGWTFVDKVYYKRSGADYMAQYFHGALGLNSALSWKLSRPVLNINPYIVRSQETIVNPWLNTNRLKFKPWGCKGCEHCECGLRRRLKWPERVTKRECGIASSVWNRRKDDLIRRQSCTSRDNTIQ